MMPVERRLVLDWLSQKKWEQPRFCNKSQWARGSQLVQSRCDFLKEMSITAVGKSIFSLCWLKCSLLAIQSFHPGDKGANQVITSLQATSGTYLAELCPCSEAHQTPEWLLQTKILSPPQPETLWTVPRSHHQGGVLRDDPSSDESQGHGKPSELTQNAEPCSPPGKLFVSCDCGCNCEWTFKEGDEARLFGKSCRHFFFVCGKQGRLMCTMKKNYIPY